MLTPVEDFTVFAGFSCLAEGVDQDLNDFIHNDAERHYLDRIAITYQLIHDEYPNIVIGFVTLQNDAIEISGEDAVSAAVVDYPYRSYPAVKIGRLGINVKLQRQRFGSVIIYLVKKLMTTANRTGCRFITADAWRDRKSGIDVSKFYLNNGFSVLPCRQKTSKTIPVFFDLATFSVEE